jgi:hypothetical protein
MSLIKAALSPPEIMLARADLMQADSNPFFVWLGQMRKSIWTDPHCGNRICEAPFEFPAYES